MDIFSQPQPKTSEPRGPESPPTFSVSMSYRYNVRNDSVRWKLCRTRLRRGGRRVAEATMTSETASVPSEVIVASAAVRRLP